MAATAYNGTRIYSYGDLAILFSIKTSLDDQEAS